LLFTCVCGYLIYTFVDADSAGTTSREYQTSNESNQVESETLIIADPAKQLERKNFINKLIAEGVIKKITSSNQRFPYVWLSDKFIYLDLKTQNQFLEVIWAFYDGEEKDFGIDEIGIVDVLILKIDDGTITGKRIGTYQPFEGVSLN